MPLFECERCGVVDNTALSDFWDRQWDDLSQLCSLCGKGEWHGEFPRELASEFKGRIEYPAREIWKAREKILNDAPKAQD